MKNLLKIAGGSLLFMIQKEAGRRYLEEQISSMPGLPMKARQLLNVGFGKSNHPEQALELQDVRAYLNNLTPQFYSQIEEIEEAFSFASLGQVHRVRLRSGRNVVVKVQYPDLDSDIEKQIKLIFSAARISPAARYGFDFKIYEDVLLRALREELDYRRESLYQNRFHALSLASKYFKIPVVDETLSNEKILIEEDVVGLSLEQLSILDEKTRLKVANHLRNFLRDCWGRFGLVHCDLHPRNWAYDIHRDQLIIYDFGSCYELTPEQRIGFLGLVDALEKQNYSLFQKSMGDLGFDLARWGAEGETIMNWLRAHFTYLGLCNKLKAEVSPPRLDSKLSWQFRASGPTWLFLPQRSFFYIERALKLLSPVDREPFSTTSAQKLNVLIEEATQTIVQIELPATAARSLKDILPEQAIFRLKATGSTVERVQHQLEVTNYIPQTIFDENENGRRLRVWLS